MDRQIVYSGAQPLETDILNTARNAMIGLGRLALDLLGASTLASGLACTPTIPASMAVAIGPGAIYSYQPVDTTAYSSLGVNTADYILKQGIVLASSGLQVALSAPATNGTSIIYLIQAQFVEQDINPQQLYYFNAANPNAPWVGPNNSGTTQNTTRQDTIAVQAKAGIASSTPVAPTVDAGFVPLYYVTVPYGATTITAGMIAAAPGAPFIPSTLPGLAPLASPAFTGTPTAPTPAAGDASSKLAPTAFVAARGAQSSGQIVLTGSTALTTAQAGANNLLNPSGAGMAVTMPAIAGTYLLSNISSYPVTLTYPSGTDYKATLQAGESVVLCGDGSGYWRTHALGFQGGFPALLAPYQTIAGASAAYAPLSAFSASLAGNGYQKLPGGMILQWCQVACTASGSTGFSWPIAFPNALLVAVPGGQSGLTYSGSYSAYLTGCSITGGTAYGNNGGGASSTVSIIAIGK